MIDRLCKLSRQDRDRLLECIQCPFHRECTERIETPEDHPDGSCKTKDQFKEILNNEFKEALKELFTDLKR